MLPAITAAARSPTNPQEAGDAIRDLSLRVNQVRPHISPPPIATRSNPPGLSLKFETQTRQGCARGGKPPAIRLSRMS